MSVLVKGMKMPENCAPCPFSNLSMDCRLTGKTVHLDWLERKRPDWCPLVEVPPHGRLIDADKLHETTYHRAFETDGDTMWQSGCWVRYRAIEQVQNSQPTIIEAEEGA